MDAGSSLSGFKSQFQHLLSPCGEIIKYLCVLANKVSVAITKARFKN